ncbi:uncharacterized protein Dsimw501_GD29028 [Drosophila simulans]|uniref:Uncharacterized protein n=1 Tax=Drosophila simulans TaxID=7240 RepID=A0A0J9UJE8_DROSI|nr:uncharacterized protein Dsimw501_GD29028 [Drosophila simulans]
MDLGCDEVVTMSVNAKDGPTGPSEVLLGPQLPPQQRTSYPVEDEVHELTAAFGEVSLVPPGSPINRATDANPRQWTQTLSAPPCRSRNG